MSSISEVRIRIFNIGEYHVWPSISPLSPLTTDKLPPSWRAEEGYVRRTETSVSYLFRLLCDCGIQENRMEIISHLLGVPDNGVPAEATWRYHCSLAYTTAASVRLPFHNLLAQLLFVDQHRGLYIQLCLKVICILLSRLGDQ